MSSPLGRFQAVLLTFPDDSLRSEELSDHLALLLHYSHGSGRGPRGSVRSQGTSTRTEVLEVPEQYAVGMLLASYYTCRPVGTQWMDVPQCLFVNLFRFWSVDKPQL